MNHATSCSSYQTKICARTGLISTKWKQTIQLLIQLLAMFLTLPLCLVDEIVLSQLLLHFSCWCKISFMTRIKCLHPIFSSILLANIHNTLNFQQGTFLKQGSSCYNFFFTCSSTWSRLLSDGLFDKEKND
jgi:hypothetical protein